MPLQSVVKFSLISYQDREPMPAPRHLAVNGQPPTPWSDRLADWVARQPDAVALVALLALTQHEPQAFVQAVLDGEATVIVQPQPPQADG